MTESGGVRKLVRDAIDQGATSVEEIHQKIAAMPLEVVQKIEPLGPPAERAKEIQQRTLGGIYAAIHALNDSVSEIGSEMLGKHERKPSE